MDGLEWKLLDISFYFIFWRSVFFIHVFLFAQFYKLHLKLIWTRDNVDTHTSWCFNRKILFEFYSKHNVIIFVHLPVDTEHIIVIKCIKLNILCPRETALRLKLYTYRSFIFLYINKKFFSCFVCVILKRFIKVFNLFFCEQGAITFISYYFFVPYLLNYLFHTRK